MRRWVAAALERAVRASDRRITGVESADYADSVSEGAVVSSTGIRTVGRETSCYVATSCVATDGDDTQTGFGFSVGRTLDDRWTILDCPGGAAAEPGPWGGAPGLHH